MIKRGWPWLFCLGVILIGMPARAGAQTIPWTNDTLEQKLNQSHLLDANRFALPAGNPEELFLQRLRSIHTKELGEALRKKYSQTAVPLDQPDPELVKKFLKNFKIKDLDLPPDLRQAFAGRENELENFIHSMELKDFLNYARKAPSLQPSPDAGGPQGGRAPETSPTPPAGQQPAASEPETPASGEAKTSEPGGSEAGAENPQANSILGRWLLQAANRAKDLDPSLRNSPVLRKAIRELSRKIEGADERWKALDKGVNAVADKWARLGEALPLGRLLPEKGLSWPRSLTPESWPNLLPQMATRSGGPVAPTMPSAGLSNLGESEGWRVLLIVAILAALGVTLQRLLARARAGSAGREGPAWKLGPWPVHPAAVRTREELIRAFEYLSLLRLGPAARHWHHLAIAAGLGQFARPAVAMRGWGDGSADRRRAAEQLAFLYERARYAPPGEPLSETALTTARRDLCLLAGVSAS